MTRRAAFAQLDPAAYRRHTLHSEESVWVEKNCYVDIWIETVHALGLDPMAMLPFVVALDFEGDQWTFFKPPHGELHELYGIDVQELTVWRPLLEHAVEHLGAGRLISTEADAFWLPDTAGTDYRRQHTKTTIVLQELDAEAGQLWYFHNAAYHALDGEDFAALFCIGAEPDPTFMPLFAELIHVERRVRREPRDLAEISLALLRRHLAWRPASNPLPCFADRFARDLSGIQARGLPYFHAWAFATLRQLGAAFELAACNLRWLRGNGVLSCEPAESAFMGIASGAKALILKVARAVNTGRALDASTQFAALSEQWSAGMQALDARLGSLPTRMVGEVGIEPTTKGL